MKEEGLWKLSGNGNLSCSREPLDVLEKLSNRPRTSSEILLSSESFDWAGRLGFQQPQSLSSEDTQNHVGS